MEACINRLDTDYLNNLFPEETRSILDLKKRTEELKSDYYAKAVELGCVIARTFKKHVKDTHHDFSLNHSKKRMRKPPESSLNANDVRMGERRNYLLFSCPKDVKEAGSLFDAALQVGVTLFVSLLESTEAEKKFNNYWQTSQLSQIATADGWTFEVQNKTVLAESLDDQKSANTPRIIETTIRAKHKEEDERTLTHIHYEGWPDREAMPSEKLFRTLLDRIMELQQGRDVPFAINCHGGVGRTGTTALSHYLQSEVDAQLASHHDPEKILVNIPRTLFKFRLQRNGFLGQEAQLVNVYSVLSDYVANLLKERSRVQEIMHPLAPVEIHDRFQFSEESCKLGELKGKVEKLKEDSAQGFRDLAFKISVQFKQFLMRKKIEGTKHDFSQNLAKLRMTYKPKELNANDIVLQDQSRFLLHACPKKVDEAKSLFDACMQSNISIFVSMLKSSDAKDRYNNFWQKDKISQMKTEGGWSFDHVESESHSEASSKIISTSLIGSKDGETRQLVHLHFDGWDQDKKVADRILFQNFLERIERLQDDSTLPIAVHSKYGVGRNGTTALLLHLRKIVRLQLSNDILLDDVEVNIPKAIFDLRLQRSGAVEHAPLIETVYSGLCDYYEILKQK